MDAVICTAVTAENVTETLYTTVVPLYSNFCHIEFFVSLGLRSCASVYRGETGIVIPVCVRPSANKLTKAVMDVSQCQCHCQSSIYIAHHRESL